MLRPGGGVVKLKVLATEGPDIQTMECSGVGPVDAPRDGMFSLKTTPCSHLKSHTALFTTEIE